LGNDRQTRTGGAKRLTIFTAAERLALYSVPDFDDFQRAEFLAFIDAELASAGTSSIAPDSRSTSMPFWPSPTHYN
jgi:hypothetical protein